MTLNLIFDPKNLSKKYSLFFRGMLILLITFGFLIPSKISFAQIKLPKIIGNNMVLQRHQPISIWGWAKKKEKITVSFLHHTLIAKADNDGKWEVKIPALNEGGPYEMTIYGKKEKVKLTNILIGEVWICSGQSNMEWPMASSRDAEKEIRQATYPFIRVFDVPNEIGFQPKDDLKGGSWEECSSSTISDFSAVAYFFGKELHEDLDVPIGLISTNWGGTNVETWISGKAITQIEGFERSIEDLSVERMKILEAEQKLKYDQLMRNVKSSAGGIINGVALWADPNYNDATWKEMVLPTLWENAGLEGLDGVIWFRKEINITASQAGEEAKLYLGPIDDSDKTWLNGIPVGETYNKYDQDRIYNIPAGRLKAGKNLITVRVEDYQGGGGIYGDPSKMQLKIGEESIPLAGKWLYQISPVDLEIQLIPMSPNERPTLLFNAMISPLIPYAFQGVIWYQGESNADRAYQYRTLFPTMIQDWRNHWGRDFPFLYVQLANFMESKSEPSESAWAELREAQLMTLNLHKTGMAVAIDIGEADDIHPRNKQDVGHRLALNAKKVAYEQRLVHSGPIYKSMDKDGTALVIEFEEIGGGLIVNDKYGYLKGFAIAGKDQKFVWAKAEIRENKVYVWSEKVPDPIAVRYAWADNPEEANLFNKEGLPASPFRTDFFKGITQPKD